MYEHKLNCILTKMKDLLVYIINTNIFYIYSLKTCYFKMEIFYYFVFMCRAFRCISALFTKFLYYLA